MTLPTPHLSGNQVVLEPFQAGDIEDAYIGWLNDPDVVRFSNQRFLRHDRASSLRYLASFAGTDNHFFGIRDRLHGRLIGTLTAYRVMAHGTADVGILIGDKTVWGRGLGQDAWNTALAWLLEQPTLRKLTAGTLACNRGMVTLAGRSGMHLEATRKAQEIVDGRPEDILLYAKFNGV